MTRFPVFIFLYLVFIEVRGDKLDFCHVGDINAVCVIEKEFHQPDKVLWIGRLPSISLQVKANPELKRGRTGKLYYTVRAPTKLMDRQVRKGSGYAHSILMRGISSADKQMRSGALFAHQLIKQGLIALDRQLTGRSKGAYDYLKKTSSLLDDKLVAGTRKTHSTVKHTLIPLNKGVVLGSTIAYGTVKKGVTTVDKRIKNSARTVDRQLSSGKLKGASIKSLLNRFIKPRSKKMKPTFSSNEPEEETENKATRASESESATPVEDDTEIIASSAGHKKDHLEGNGKEEANGFDMEDQYNNNQHHGRDHDHQNEDSITQEGYDKQMNFDGKTRNVGNNRKRLYSQLGRFTDRTLKHKQITSRGYYSKIVSDVLPKSLLRSFSKIAQRTPESFTNNNSMRSLSKFKEPKSLFRIAGIPKSLSKLHMPMPMMPMTKKVQV